jgi:hypothetical protein
MSMSFMNPNFWLFVVTICSIALLTEVCLLIRMLLMSRQRLWRYLLVMIPVAKCIWSFAVIWYVLNTDYFFLSYTGMTYAPLRLIREANSQCIHLCQLQVGIIIASFAITLIVERIALPHTNRPPVWSPTKDRLLGPSGVLLSGL